MSDREREYDSAARRRIEMPMRVDFGKPRLTVNQAVSAFSVNYDTEALPELERRESLRGVTDGALNKPESMEPPIGGGVPFSEPVRRSRLRYCQGYEFGLTLDLAMRAVDVASWTYPAVTEAEKLKLARFLADRMIDTISDTMENRREGA